VTRLTPEDFFAVFDTFHVSALRLETLPAFDVGDYGDEVLRLRAFREGLPLPEQSVLTDPWLAQVARTALAGKTWDRVRIVDRPLTEYQRVRARHVRGETRPRVNESSSCRASTSTRAPTCG
jgi:hypothetical protein